jgi:hypothetical protein
MFILLCGPKYKSWASYQIKWTVVIFKFCNDCHENWSSFFRWSGNNQILLWHVYNVKYSHKETNVHSVHHRSQWYALLSKYDKLHLWYLPQTYSSKSDWYRSVHFMHGGRTMNQAVAGLSPWSPGSISDQSTLDLWFVDFIRELWLSLSQYRSTSAPYAFTHLSSTTYKH